MLAWIRQGQDWSGGAFSSPFLPAVEAPQRRSGGKGSISLPRSRGSFHWVTGVAAETLKDALQSRKARAGSPSEVVRPPTDTSCDPRRMKMWCLGFFA